MKPRNRTHYFSDREFEKFLKERPDVGVISSMPASLTVSDLPKDKGGNKWGNIPTKVDGYQFQSKLEANRYSVLKEWEKVGLIRDLSVQFDDKPKHTWVLQDGRRLPNGKKQRAITYIDDFQYRQTDTGLFIVEDCKGKLNNIFILKEKMFRSRYPDVILFLNYTNHGWYKPQ